MCPACLPTLPRGDSTASPGQVLGLSCSGSPPLPSEPSDLGLEQGREESWTGQGFLPGPLPAGR